MTAKISDLSAASVSKGTDLKEIYDPTLPDGTRSKKVTLNQDVAYINANAQLASPKQITGLYADGVEPIDSGAETTYVLTYPLAPRYAVKPNADVTVGIRLPAYDSTKCDLGQSIEARNIGGTNSAVQFFTDSGNLIANTSIPPGASFIGRLIIDPETEIFTIDVIRIGTIAGYDTTEFLSIDGGTMAGAVIGYTDTPTAPREFAPKIYVDSNFASIANLTSYQSLSKAADFAIPNPLGYGVIELNLTMTNPGKAYQFPAMNESDSIVRGTLLIISNAGSNAFLLRDAAGAPIISSFAVAQVVILRLTDNTSPGGTFETIYNNTTFLQKANNLSDLANALTALNNLGLLGKHDWPLPMGSAFPAITNGATLVQIENSPNNFRGFSFAQSGVNALHWRLPLPKSWDQGGFSFFLYWKTSATTGTVTWYIDGIIRNNNSGENTAFGTAVTIDSNAAASAYNEIIQEVATSMFPAGTPGNNCELELRIRRNGGVGDDNMAAAAILIGATMKIGIAAGNDV